MSVVLPVPSVSKVATSSKGISANFISSPIVSPIDCKHLSNIVRFVNPKKSILRRPNLATGSIEYCVVNTLLSSEDLDGRCNGTVSVKGLSEIRTAAA